MMDEAAGRENIAPVTTPYPPSWMDRLVEWIERQPGPSWLYYLISTIIFALIINLVFWVDGSLPLGTFHPVNTAASFLILYWLVLYHYLTRGAITSLKSFSPFLEANEEELAGVKHRLTMLPRWQGWLAIPLGILLAAMTIFTEPNPYGEVIPNTILPSLIDILLTGFMMATLYGLIVRSLRQIRMVRKLHRQASNINLLKLGPAHAFSALTARTGMGVIFLVVIGTLLDDAPLDNAVDFFWYLVTSLLSVALFVMPVIGMRERLEQEKERVLNEIGDLLQRTSSHLHDKIGQGEYEALDGQEIAIKALTHERELFERASTWPWDPRTIRGFASALLLPILIWIVTQLLDRII